MIELKQAYEACHRIVKSGDEDRYFAALLAPHPQRDHLMALYALNLELAKIRLKVSEPMLGEIRLQWWREVLDQIYGGLPVRQHEVALALAAAIKTNALKKARLEAIIDARRVEFYDEPIGNTEDLESYVDRTEVGLMRLALVIVKEAASEGILAKTRARGFALIKQGVLSGDPLFRKFPPMDVPLTRPAQFSAMAAPAVLHLATLPFLTKAKPASALRRRIRMLSCNLRGRV